MGSELTGKSKGAVARRSSASEIDSFLKAASPSGGGGRLVFALDATMSRQPTWDRACRLQGELFGAAGEGGSLLVQLLYFRGFSECRASPFVRDATALRDLMSRIDCRGGQTQIRKVLAHTRREANERKLAALVYIGDAMEEDVDALCRVAGEIGVLGTKCIMVQDGGDATCERAFREIARLSKGAYIQLDENSADALRNLLRAVGTFAARGSAALESDRTREARLLIEQMRRGA